MERHLPASWEEFDGNELVRVWCLRHLEIIGEAATRLSQDVRAKAPTIPWKPIVGMRNTLVHACFDVNWRRVREVLAHDLRPLKAGVEALLKAIEEGAP
ncbi:MAG: hypothetical protein AW08_01706 [Candidatus Accumulibacter adjunctus]|uniref:DUF86 domain-containing protein n=1 Tax=Candidatus Accumulibacter adjunctus TaxID=1454001 RepID=A0A011NTA3_9PROT|nr:MAG: hypothetical protein AW08_01706 [Candidatus Accumulibacter adjunctus]